MMFSILNMEFADRLKSRMRELELSAVELAAQVGVSKGAITHWTNGTNQANGKRLLRLAEVLRCDASWLASGQGSAGAKPEAGNIHVAPPPARSISYPVISLVSAGEWMEAIESYPVGMAAEYITTDYQGSGMCFWAKVTGDSMTSNYGQSFPDGCYVLVDTGLSAAPGLLVVAKRVQDDEATFKKLVADAGRQYLRPLNPAFEMLPIDEETRIIGVVKEMRQRF